MVSLTLTLSEETKKKLLGKFNLETVRTYQEEVIVNLLNKKDVFLAQPTGSGKSLIFQALPFAKHFDLQKSKSPAIMK